MITWKYDCWENNNRKIDRKQTFVLCNISSHVLLCLYSTVKLISDKCSVVLYTALYFNHDLQQRQVAKAVNKIVGLKAFNTVISQFTTTDWDVSTTEQIENMISYDSANSLTQWQIETKIQAENLIPSQATLFACCTRPKF